MCSGIESASVAWHDLPDWKPAFFSEIDPFCRSVLSHRFPLVPLHGDFTAIENGMYEPIDLLVGGTPCQDFSIAGLREGMKGERGNLTLEFVRLAQRLKPKYLLWENVPGVLSSNGGRDFGAFLGALDELGFGVAWRILDAKFLGVPQRRRRVFLVGCAGGDRRRAEQILFDGDGMCRHSHKSKKARESVAALTASGVGTCGVDDNQAQAGHLIAHTLRGEGFDASEDGTGRGTPLVPIIYRTNAKGQVNEQGDISAALTTSTDPCTQILAFDTTQITSSENQSQIEAESGDVAPTLLASGAGVARTGSHRESEFSIPDAQGVRRLMPIETERLQGFPDGHTDVPYRGKTAADGPRYKAIGNSMAVPCMRWIGERIHAIEMRSQIL